jgi:hypothetical protein
LGGRFFKKGGRLLDVFVGIWYLGMMKRKAYIRTPEGLYYLGLDFKVAALANVLLGFARPGKLVVFPSLSTLESRMGLNPSVNHKAVNRLISLLENHELAGQRLIKVIRAPKKSNRYDLTVLWEKAWAASSDAKWEEESDEPIPVVKDMSKTEHTLQPTYLSSLSDEDFREVWNNDHYADIQMDNRNMIHSYNLPYDSDIFAVTIGDGGSVEDYKEYLKRKQEEDAIMTIQERYAISKT